MSDLILLVVFGSLALSVGVFAVCASITMLHMEFGKKPKSNFHFINGKEEIDDDS